MSQMNREDFFFFFKNLLHFSQIVEEKSSFLSLKEMALLSLFAKKVKSSVGETFSRSQYFTKIVKSRKSRTTKAHKNGWFKFVINAESFFQSFLDFDSSKGSMISLEGSSFPSSLSTRVTQFSIVVDLNKFKNYISVSNFSYQFCSKLANWPFFSFRDEHILQS